MKTLESFNLGKNLKKEGEPEQAKGLWVEAMALGKASGRKWYALAYWKQETRL